MRVVILKNNDQISVQMIKKEETPHAKSSNYSEKNDYSKWTIVNYFKLCLKNKSYGVVFL